VVRISISDPECNVIRNRTLKKKENRRNVEGEEMG
jgi:hypothetical protein